MRLSEMNLRFTVQGVRNTPGCEAERRYGKGMEQRAERTGKRGAEEGRGCVAG